MKIFAFDRDDTLDISKGPVPLDEVKRLAHRTNNDVWAIGNQKLKDEANIPGIAEARAELITRAKTAPNQYSAWKSPPKKPGRKKRLLMVEALYPEAHELIHIDDDNVFISHRERWKYYRPADFVDEYL